ncbi:hypothetical protein ACJJTC_016881 [Scirpophaga incertulas]
MDNLSSKISIGLLEGKSNWSTWKYKILVLLRNVERALDVIEGKIYETVVGTKTTLKKVMRYTSSREVWLELHRLYDGISEDRSYNLCMEFFGFKRDLNDDIATHLSKLKKYLDTTRSRNDI